MGLRQLEYMLKVAEERSFSKAAKKLNIAQPSLSQYILNLEKSMGIALFDRTKTPISLTHAGEVFRLKAEEILRMNHELKTQMEDMAGLKIGKVTIGISQTGAHFIPKVMARFYKKFPSVEVDLLEASSSEEMEKWLQEGVVDLATLILPLSSDILSYEIIQEEKMLVALPIHHPLVKEMKTKEKHLYPWISLSLLKDEQFILPKSTQRSRMVFDTLFQEAGFLPKILCETKTMDTANAIVASGLGVGFTLPQVIRADDKDKLALFSLNSALMTRTLVLAYKKEKYLPKIAHEFLSIAKRVVQ